MYALGKLSRISVMTAMLCACTPQESPFKGSNLIRVIPGGRAVSVVNVKVESEARPWATEYCNKQGLSPRFRGMGVRYRTTTAEYDCA